MTNRDKQIAKTQILGATLLLVEVAITAVTLLFLPIITPVISTVPMIAWILK